MILNSPLSIPPTPLAGPRKVGDDSDYIELDPANGQISVAGAASPLTIQDLLLAIAPQPEAGEGTCGAFTPAVAGLYPFAPDTMWAVPCALPYRLTYTHMKLYVSTGQAGSKGLMGVYNSNAAMTRPGTLISATPEFTPTTTEHLTVAFAAGQTFGPGLFWLVYTVDTAAIVIQRHGSTSGLRWKTYENGASNQPVSYVSHARAYDSSLPATFSTGALTNSSDGPPRLILIRAA